MDQAGKNTHVQFSIVMDQRTNAREITYADFHTAYEIYKGMKILHPKSKINIYMRHVTIECGEWQGIDTNDPERYLDL